MAASGRGPVKGRNMLCSFQARSVILALECKPSHVLRTHRIVTAPVCDGQSNPGTRLPRIIGPAHVPRELKRVSASSSEAPVPDTRLTLTHLHTQTCPAHTLLSLNHNLRNTQAPCNHQVVTISLPAFLLAIHRDGSPVSPLQLSFLPTIRLQPSELGLRDHPSHQRCG